VKKGQRPPLEALDLGRVRTVPLGRRPSKVRRAALGQPVRARRSMRRFLDGLPDFLGAADAQHVAAELVGRLRRERRALAAIALTTDTSALTAIANDYGYDEVFARQVRGLGRQGDVAVAISTSGNSPGILKAVEACRELGVRTIGLTGGSGGKLAGVVDCALVVSSTTDTQRIQETHILIGHVLCELVDEHFGDGA
jgi:D-sedoheptulose 7-phosphate isomerase